MSRQPKLSPAEEELAQRLALGKASGRDLAQARSIVMSGTGTPFARSVESVSSDELDRLGRATRLMAVLERVMVEDELVGAYLMVHLSRLAGAAHASNIFDAIELWMDHLDSADAQQAMRSALRDPLVRPLTKKRCELWLKNMSARGRK